MNIPPTDEGLFHENDVKRLHEIGEYLRKEYAVNLAEQSGASVETQENGRMILVKLPGNDNVSHVVLQENIRFSQRVENFRVEVWQDGAYKTIYRGTVVGYKKIITFHPAIRTDSLRIVIEDCRREPKIMFVGIY